MLSEKDQTAGGLLRDWRQRRRLSQLALAVDAEISQRHLSFVESGRALPSRDMVLRLTQQLGVPLRERNIILVAAGFAPIYRERPLDAPELGAAKDAIERIVHGHVPHPALAVDRRWNLIMANRAMQLLLADVADHLLSGTVNVLRLSLHPEGLAPRIRNLQQWRDHVLARLAHEIDICADASLAALREELASYPVAGRRGGEAHAQPSGSAIAVPLLLDWENGTLAFLGTTTVFGTAIDVTLSEITIETFFPADAPTAAAMAAMLAP